MTEADNEQSANSRSNVSLFEKYKFLPLDTKHFSKAIKYKILSSFKDIESTLNGELIKSDNFQALNTLLPKYQNKVDLIYIDPPFNTGSDFEYKDKFQDSTWLTLMENRLELAKEFLSDRGSFYLHLDYNANYLGKELLNDIFGKQNFINEIIWNYRGTTNTNIKFAPKHDTIYLYGYENHIFNFDDVRIPYEDDNKFSKDENGKYYMMWEKDQFYYPPQKFENNEWILLGKSQYDVWNDIPSMATAHGAEFLNFSTQKQEKLLQRIIKASSNENSIIFDYHLGSGTTIATAHKLGRKWLGVEMGEHFYKVIIPRMKKVIGGFVSGISKEVEFKGGGAFRYYELESYEESLENCEYILSSDNAEVLSMNFEGCQGGGEGSLLDANDQTDNADSFKICDKTTHLIDYRKSRKLIKGLKKGEKICLDMSKYNKSFDIFTTMSNLLGLKIKSIFLDENGIQSCKFENDDIVNLETIDLIKYPKLRNLIWWEK